MTVIIRRNTQHPYRYQVLPKNRSTLKKTVSVVMLLGFMLYVLIDFKLKNRNFEGHLKRHHAIEKNISLGNVVDTIGCRIPYFNVSDKAIDDFTSKHKNYSCGKALTLVFLDKPKLFLNMNDSEIRKLYNVNDMEEVNCYYNEIKREADREHNQYMEKIKIKLRSNETISIRPDYEFINFECAKADGEVFYKDFHFIARDKTQQKTSAEMTATEERKSNVSVMILGLDSVSHLNFLRQMKQTSYYIRENLTNVEFWGYNTIANSCFSNLMPILTGMDENELDISCRSSSLNDTYDNCAFIWKRFKESGYQTVFAEDVSQMSLFNNLRPGFKRQPTDYYMHPIVDEMEKHIGYEKISGNMQLCKGSRRSVDVVLEMMHRLIPLYRHQLFFSFFWTVTMTHDFQSMPQMLDFDLKKVLVNFEREGILNNTVLFLISDHGIHEDSFRNTYEDMIEERQPLFIALYPHWMRQRFPRAIANLELNSKRLTTPFDLHYTISDLLDLRNLENERIRTRARELQEITTMPRGISLFLPIPETRSCALAAIASHWCTCQEEEEIPTNNVNVQHAARHTIELMNAKLKDYLQCHTLHLNAIQQAFVAVTHSKELKTALKTSDYGINIKVRVQATPGLGEFESTVWMSTDLTTTHVSGIKRLNFYANQSDCIDDKALKMFCFCTEKPMELYFLE